MPTTITPIMYKAQEVSGYLDSLADDIKATIGKDADLLLNHPAVYVHVWRNKEDIMNGTWSIYVGETNDIVSRTKEHWAEAKVPVSKRKSGNWQYHMIEDVDDKGKQIIPTVYFFGHKLGSSSLSLHLENATKIRVNY